MTWRFIIVALYKSRYSIAQTSYTIVEAWSLPLCSAGGSLTGHAYVAFRYAAPLLHCSRVICVFFQQRSKISARCTLSSLYNVIIALLANDILSSVL